MQPEYRSDPGLASGLELPQPRGLFDPAKPLLDSLPGVDRLPLTRIANGAAIDSGAAAGLDVPRNMGRDAQEALISHKIPGVVAHVVRPMFSGEHPQANGPSNDSCTLPVAIGWGQLAGHHKPVAVLHQATEISLGALLLLTGSSAESLAAARQWRLVIIPVDSLRRAVGGPSPQQGECFAISIETTRSFLFWFLVINYGVLMLWFMAFSLAHDLVYRLHAR